MNNEEGPGTSVEDTHVTYNRSTQELKIFGLRADGLVSGGNISLTSDQARRLAQQLRDASDQALD